MEKLVDNKHPKRVRLHMDNHLRQEGRRFTGVYVEIHKFPAYPPSSLPSDPIKDLETWELSGADNMKRIAPIYTAYAAHMMRQDMNTPLDTEMCQKLFCLEYSGIYLYIGWTTLWSSDLMDFLGLSNLLFILLSGSSLQGFAAACRSEGSM